MTGVVVGQEAEAREEAKKNEEAAKKPKIKIKLPKQIKDKDKVGACFALEGAIDALVALQGGGADGAVAGAAEASLCSGFTPSEIGRAHV